MFFCIISVSFVLCVFCPKVFKIMIINRRSEDAIVYGKINIKGILRLNVVIKKTFFVFHSNSMKLGKVLVRIDN